MVPSSKKSRKLLFPNFSTYSEKLKDRSDFLIFFEDTLWDLKFLYGAVQCALKGFKSKIAYSIVASILQSLCSNWFYNRTVGSGRVGGQSPPLLILTNQLTKSQSGGADFVQPITTCPPDIHTFSTALFAAPYDTYKNNVARLRINFEKLRPLCKVLSIWHPLMYIVHKYIFTNKNIKKYMTGYKCEIVSLTSAKLGSPNQIKNRIRVDESFKKSNRSSAKRCVI